MNTNSPQPATLSNGNTELVQLVRSAQAGCRKSFGELFERFYATVFAVTLKFSRNRHTAEELCQDVFIQAMEKLGQRRQPECFGAWLRSIARRKAINQQTRNKYAVNIPAEIFAATLSDGDVPVDRVLEKERAEVLQEGLSQLGSLDRQTLTAFYLRHQSIARMSNEFDAPLGTIKRRLHVARQRLAEQIDPLVAL
ncbi:MAG: sigma-70 family RNA polymerase sigma factor [Pirellulaceae bacterium]